MRPQARQVVGGPRARAGSLAPAGRRDGERRLGDDALERGGRGRLPAAARRQDGAGRGAGRGDERGRGDRQGPRTPARAARGAPPGPGAAAAEGVDQLARGRGPVARVLGEAARQCVIDAAAQARAAATRRAGRPG